MASRYCLVRVRPKLGGKILRSDGDTYVTDTAEEPWAVRNPLYRNAFTCSQQVRPCRVYESEATGQKKAEPAVKGTLSFDQEKKCVDFLDESII